MLKYFSHDIYCENILSVLSNSNDYHGTLEIIYLTIVLF